MRNSIAPALPLSVSAQTHNRFQALLIQLQKAGYIEGLNIVQYIRQPERIEPPMEPHITLQGLEYLQENSLMKKAAAFAKGVKEIVPGI